MDEHSYIRSIHRTLPTSVHSWKIAAKFHRGIPDAWYSGDRADCWIEYKYLKKTPKRKFTPALNANQKKWLRDRHAEGRNVAVIVGTPDGAALLLDRSWEEAVTVPTKWLTQREITAWIINTTCSSTVTAP